MSEYEYVQHPQHYGNGENDPYECIKVIDAWEMDFYTGTALRYICRAGKKPDNSEIQDLNKAVNYLQMKIRKLEREEKANGKAI